MNDPLNLLTPPPSPLPNILGKYNSSKFILGILKFEIKKKKKKNPKENFDTKNSLKNKKHMPVVHPNTYRKSFFFILISILKTNPSKRKSLCDCQQWYFSLKLSLCDCVY